MTIQEHERTEWTALIIQIILCVDGVDPSVFACVSDVPAGEIDNVHEFTSSCGAYRLICHSFYWSLPLRGLYAFLECVQCSHEGLERMWKPLHTSLPKLLFGRVIDTLPGRHRRDTIDLNSCSHKCRICSSSFR
jgi:hypothetical protein